MEGGLRNFHDINFAWHLLVVDSDATIHICSNRITVLKHFTKLKRNLANKHMLKSTIEVLESYESYETKITSISPSTVFVVNFEHISHLLQVFLLLL